MRKEQTGNHAAGTGSESDAGWFRVTYFDGHCGRSLTEDFDEQAEAEHFARCRVQDEDDWAIVDAMPLRAQTRAA